MLRWADKQRCWIEEGVYFDNKSLDEWIALKFNPGDSTALYSSADKGISILKCRVSTSAHLEDLRRQEEIWDAPVFSPATTRISNSGLKKNSLKYLGTKWCLENLRSTTSQRSSTAYFAGTQNNSRHKRILQGIRRNW